MNTEHKKVKVKTYKVKENWNNERLPNGNKKLDAFVQDYSDTATVHGRGVLHLFLILISEKYISSNCEIYLFRTTLTQLLCTGCPTSSREIKLHFTGFFGFSLSLWGWGWWWWWWWWRRWWWWWWWRMGRPTSSREIKLHLTGFFGFSWSPWGYLASSGWGWWFPFWWLQC